MCDFYQHPSAPVVLHATVPVTAQSVIAAISACNAERRQVSVQTGVCLPMAQVPAWCLSVEGSK